ncbi:uncharacterized protein LOC126746855 [Anthonomus grandis grandis]|uniref:uncharacterized protein LOC126746855 n=1 Tax=Anthonomus grandis grandis TaxID=2921223 RepID=UPI0021661CD1|nr:uncharacterized protein LOC126746855 [Anthonomus grandis grandis]
MYLIFTTIFIINQITIVSADCQINPLQIQPCPLITNKNSQVIYPDSSTHLTSIETLDKINIACPGNHLMHQGVPIGESIEVTCETGETFKYQEENVNFYSLRCESIPKNIVRYTHNKCLEGGEEIEIGYELTDKGDGFIRQIKICFNSLTLIPLYSHYNLTKTIGYRDSGVARVFFEENGFYPTSANLDTLYRKDFQRSTINNLLSLPNNSFNYIKPSGETFINRGHLTAKGDFVYAFQQLATFHYVNSAPQWASFNGGNWNEVEISVRDYANRYKADLQVFTGVHGVSSLSNQYGKTDLYLHTIKGKMLLPVPRLFWKLLYDPERDAGVVLIGVNNAHELDEGRDIICKDVFNKISWLNRKLERQHHDIGLGYVYACTVSDFMEVVNTFPRITVSTLLT